MYVETEGTLPWWAVVIVAVVVGCVAFVSSIIFGASFVG